MLASKQNGTLSVGVTSDLLKRVYQHKNKILDGFSKKYTVDTLVYYETYTDSVSAITREKRLKKWERKWKVQLIENKNPLWEDLSNRIGL